MTTLNFKLAHSIARTLRAGRRDRRHRCSTTTRTSRPGCWSPRTTGSSCARSTSTRATARSTSTRSSALLGDADAGRRVHAASNGVGTIPDARRISELAHGVGALAWADGVHYAPHRRIDVGRARRRRARCARRTSSSARTSASRTAAATCSSLARRPRAPGGRGAARPPLRDRHPEPRGDRRRVAADRLPRLARRAADRRAAGRRVRADPPLRGGAVASASWRRSPSSPACALYGIADPARVASARRRSRSPRRPHPRAVARRSPPTASRLGRQLLRARADAAARPEDAAAPCAPGSCTTRARARSTARSTPGGSPLRPPLFSWSTRMWRNW